MRQVMQVNTYGGHAAAASRNIEILLEEALPQRVADTGRYLIDNLAALKQHKHVGEVRGKGLLIGVELVMDQTTKQPVAPADIQFVVDFCKANGVIVGRSAGGRRYSNTIALSPPLVITRRECDRLVEVLDRAVMALTARLAS